MQVLIENPYAPLKHRPLGLVPSFWSENAFYIGNHFSMGSLMEESTRFNLSPFAVLDARVAFLLGQVNKGTSILARNIGPLAVVVAHFDSLSVTHNEDRKKVDSYLKEYLPPKEVKVSPELDHYDQIVVFGECDIQDHLWEKLKVGGYYILASYSEGLQISKPGTDFEAMGKIWPHGEATEFGWKFTEEELGLFGFEFCKLKKLK